MDVLWMRIPREDDDGEQTLGRVVPRHVLIMINRKTYWQCAFLIPKGSFAKIKVRGLPDFRANLKKLAPFLGDRVEEIRDWEQVRLLTVTVDRLKRWHRPGLLCIGDSAHAMSPVGGVGINLAIQDAVATANLLTGALQTLDAITESQLAEVQRRRMFPTRATQRAQIFIQEHVIRPVLTSDAPIHVSGLLRLLKAVPWLQRFPAQMVGLGFRAEHIQT